MSESHYAVNLDRYSSSDLEACDEVEIVNVEDRKGKRRKPREKASAAPADDVIVIVVGSTAKNQSKEATIISSDSEDGASGVVPYDLTVKGAKRRRSQPHSSVQVGAGEVLFVKEVKAQTDKDGAPSGTTLPPTGAVQDGKWLKASREECRHGHQKGKEKAQSHGGIGRGRGDEVRDGSVSPDLPDCSFLPPVTTHRTRSVDEGISSLDVLHSFPEVGVSSKEERFWSIGTPLYWTECSNCTAECVGRDCTTTYHCVKVEAEVEWDHVTGPLAENKFRIESVFRIQNFRLWKRYKSEMELMLDGAHEGYQLNQAWLYHMTMASWRTVCEEGLDPRLAREGCFGRGTYFSDNPVKCHHYSRPGSNRHTIILCRVLLGDIKVYPNRHTDRGLKREPSKSHPKKGEKKTYDSVMGNLTGQDEYVIYNPYRSLPEYVIEYTSYEPLGGPPLRPTVAGGGSYQLAAALRATANAFSSMPPGFLGGPLPPPAPLPNPHNSQPPQPVLPWAAMTHHQRRQHAAQARAARTTAWTRNS